MDFPLFSDYFRVGRDEILVRNPDMSRDAVERPGSDANALVAAMAGMAEEITHQLVSVQSGSFLDSAVGDELERLAFDRYGLSRKPASAAQTSVTFSTTAPNPSLFVIPAGTRLETRTGLAFLTTEPGTFLAGDTSILVPVRSLLAGSDQNARIGTITVVPGRIVGAPADLTVTNTLATTGAADAEADGPLRERARSFFVNARRGTIGALESGALAVPGVVRAKAVEVLDGLGRPARYVSLVVADQYTDQFAELAAVPPAYQAQSQLLAQSVFLGLDDVRAAGIFVDVIVAQVVLQPIRLGLRFQAGVDADLVALRARAAVVNLVNALRPGGRLRLGAVVDRLRGVSGLLVAGDEVLSPPGDVVASPHQVLRSTLGLVTAGSVQSEQPLAGSANPDAFEAGG